MSFINFINLNFFMKKLTYVLIVLSALLALNVLVFVLSPDYRFYLKKLKYWDLPVDKNEIITDNYSPDFSNKCDCSKCLVNTSTWEISQSWSLTWTWETYNSKDIEILTKTFSGITFTPKAYDEYYKIFGITDEYLKKYETYTSDNLEIYYFPETNFDEAYNFFETLTFDLPITLNRLNNFWQRSFYLNKKTSDDFVRVVIKYDNKIFWLKIKNIYYNEIRKILEKL